MHDSPAASPTAVEVGALLPFVDPAETIAAELPELHVSWEAQPVADPRLLVLNQELAGELGADPLALASPDGVAVLAGNAAPQGAAPVAQAYAGHQFGGLSPRLGDGRALLLGEVVDTGGHRVDVQLKGSGRTPFARGGDGRAAVGPMLREYLMGEAMHALGIPTTRMLAVVATGEQVQREVALPGAVLTRVAASHIRVGTFQYAAMHHDTDLVRRLADHAIARHHPDAAGTDQPYLALLDAVTASQASLVASWMLVGFIHGVLNTDNVTISGETIDYGPCAFMDAFDPATVFSSIDHGGRYAYGNQPAVTQWNLARFAETLLPLLAEDTDEAVALAVGVLDTFPDRFRAAWNRGLAAKLGLDAPGDLDSGAPGDEGLLDEVPALLGSAPVDMTSFFRALADALRAGDDSRLRTLFDDPTAFDAWAPRWRAAVEATGRSAADSAAAMDRVNPCYIPRNHLVEEALDAATDGDLAPFEELLAVLADPFTHRPGLERFAEPAPASFGPHRTFCGT